MKKHYTGPTHTPCDCTCFSLKTQGSRKQSRITASILCASSLNANPKMKDVRIEVILIVSCALFLLIGILHRRNADMFGRISKVRYLSFI